MKPRRTILNFATLGMVLFALGACGADGSPELGEGEPDAETRTAAAAIFDESLEDDKCSVFTREDAGAAAGVPPDMVEQPYAGMCLYSWEGGSGHPEGNLNVMGVTVHETVEQARSEHARFTVDVTAEEVGAATDDVQEALAAKRDEGELTADEEAVASAVVGTMPEMDFTHRRWDDIGDGASSDGRGTVRVLYGNVTVWMTGKTDSEDWIDPGVAREVARLIVANLEGLR